MKTSKKLIKLASFLERLAKKIVETDSTFLLDTALQNELNSIYAGDRSGARYYYKANSKRNQNGLRLEFRLAKGPKRNSYLTIFCTCKKTKEAADKAIRAINEVVEEIIESSIKTYYSIELGDGIEHNSPKGNGSKEPLKLWFTLELEKI